MIEIIFLKRKMEYSVITSVGQKKSKEEKVPVPDGNRTHDLPLHPAERSNHWATGRLVHVVAQHALASQKEKIANLSNQLSNYVNIFLSF